MTVEDWGFDEEQLPTHEELLLDYYNELHRTHYVVEKWLARILLLLVFCLDVAVATGVFVVASLH